MRAVGRSVSVTAFVAGSTRSSRSRNGIALAVRLVRRHRDPDAVRGGRDVDRAGSDVDRRLDGARRRIDAKQVGSAAGDPERALGVGHPLRCVAGKSAERRRGVRGRVDPLERPIPVVDDPEPAGVLRERRGAVAGRDRRDDSPPCRVVAQERARFVVGRPHGAGGRPDVGESAARDRRPRSGPSAGRSGSRPGRARHSRRRRARPRSSTACSSAGGSPASRPRPVRFGAAGPVGGKRPTARRSPGRGRARTADTAGRCRRRAGRPARSAARRPVRAPGGRSRRRDGAGPRAAATVRRTGRPRAGGSGSCLPVSPRRPES